ncbi:MAG: ferritin-like domain-containing protein [Verrucomicrobiales bacterium]
MNTKDTPELNRLLVDQLKDVYWAEKKLATTLPKLAKKAQSRELQAAFESHCDETLSHVSRLEEMFDHLGLKPHAKKCDAMEGLIEEGNSLAEEYAASPALDAALIAAAQKVEHYEIATYGTMRAFAKNLGLNELVRLITLTIDEEGAADKKLTKIAETKSNRTAEKSLSAA